MSNKEQFEFLDDLQKRILDVRRKLTYSSRKWKVLRNCNVAIYDRFHRLLLEMEELRSQIITHALALDEPKEDTSIPFLHWADATPFQRKLLGEGVVLRGYAPQDEETPRARERRTDMPR